MKPLKDYLKEILGLDLQFKPVPEKELERLPFFIKNAFRFIDANLTGHPLLLLEIQEKEEQPTIQQIEKQFNTIADALHRTPVLVIEDITPISRKRLINKAINFIVPGKQLFLPALLLDFKEQFRKPQKTKRALLPSAQVILLYRILHRNEKIEQLPLKVLAEKLKYTPMAVTKAAENLKEHSVCEITGTKERYINFPTSIPELWHMAQPFLVTPVLKAVYVDALPENVFLMRSNTSALPEYSDMNESLQQFRAIEKNIFYDLQKTHKLLNANDKEGAFCLEVWKYDPAVLAEGITDTSNVDPLSLYLSLKDHQDERIEQALEKIIADYIW
jgi:hypothetical protein